MSVPLGPEAEAYSRGWDAYLAGVIPENALAASSDESPSLQDDWLRGYNDRKMRSEYEALPPEQQRQTDIGDLNGEPQPSIPEPV